ncbi:maleylpyruvate isomerase N-terminal domain-containing protein [Streptomyces sp. ISL-98]|uniref:maleylpyruvate isomerase N-terminal domain-containing protein n=1 Tax=Streptomyces sp. ISL-98 TaxID=2819192 RepID=UPI001BE80A6B|nr:maleylpyruvate isomerase N-terminal domain-containing protein [Streptomyces sp. ISL-98]MBT2509753.1 maleylpyruvate isomerase N-terminal domain-containing protein [Streptomyces sp. ISL-98]
MDGETVLAALRAESQRLYEKVCAIPEGEWDRPSPCDPWTVREVFAHLTNAVDRVGSMLAEPEPEPSGALVTAAGYYAPDERFSTDANEVRIETAQDSAGWYADGRALAEHFDSVWRSVTTACAKEPPERRVRTRHGDPMLLSDFLVTRVVEVCVHGFDVAVGLGHEPWPTDEAADVVARLLLGGRPYDASVPVPGGGWDRTTFLRKATGRLPMTAAERAAERLGLRRLTLG